jgi:hypothetical protein
MIEAGEICKRLFILGVAGFAILPRQFIDRNYFSIGGDLAHSFRKLLLVLTGLNLIRFSSTFKDRSVVLEHLSDTLGVVEVVGLNFLCFLTPYKLQEWLHCKINIGGRPGEKLMVPLYMTIALSITGVVLSRTAHPNFWCLKKVANLFSGPLVLQTLKQFNSVTHIGGHQHGRGSIISQSLVLVELWYFATQLLCAVGYAMNKDNAMDDYSQWDHCLLAFRTLSFVSDWTRIYAHANFINQLDELYLTHANEECDPRETNEEETAQNDCTEVGSSQLVSLVRRVPV